MRSKDNHRLKKLVSEAKTGNSEAQNELYQEMRIRLLDYVRSKIKGWSDEEYKEIIHDIITEYFIAAFIKKTNRAIDNPIKYARGIARHKINDALRKIYRKKGKRGKREEKDDDELDAKPKSKGHINEAISDPDSDIVHFLDTKDKIEQAKTAVKKLGKFCQAWFMNLFEYRPLIEFWLSIKKIEPDLKRNAFDQRIRNCRRRIIKLMRGKIR